MRVCVCLRSVQNAEDGSLRSEYCIVDMTIGVVWMCQTVCVCVCVCGYNYMMHVFLFCFPDLLGLYVGGLVR